MFKVLMTFLFIMLTSGCGSMTAQETSGAKSGPQLAATVSQLTAVNTPGTDQYRLRVGDLIRIQVFGEPDLEVETFLDADGAITYPYLGQVAVVGKTATEVRQHISTRLDGDYLVDPKVTVTVQSTRLVFIGGEVVRSGSIPYQPGLTVERAILISGGFTDRASRRSVKVESEGEAKSKRVRLDYILQPGDLVTVQRRFF